MRRLTNFNGEDMTLSEAVARIVNAQINELVERCVKNNEYQKPSGNSQLLKAAETVGCDFEKDVVDGLLHASENEDSFRKHIKELHEMSLIDMDDFTFVWIHE